MSVSRRLLLEESGSALVELALALPLLIVVLAGTVDYGIYEERKMQVTEAASAAAGYGALTPNQLNTVGMQSAAAAASPSLSGLQVSASVFWTCTPGGAQVASNTVCSSNNGYNYNPVQYVQVATSALVNPPMPLPALGSGITVRAQATYRVRWKPS